MTAQAGRATMRHGDRAGGAWDMNDEHVELWPFAGYESASEHWRYCKDGNATARGIFDRHYSRYRYRDGRKPKLFVGPGQKIVLVTEGGDALFTWRKFKSADGQQGVNCSIFRNESNVLSSELIREAMEIAWRKWPGARFFTYVKTAAVRGDGACFKHAGWRKCGRTKVNRLLILECTPELAQGRLAI